jgi:hypothetical protein
MAKLFSQGLWLIERTNSLLFPDMHNSIHMEVIALLLLFALAVGTIVPSVVCFTVRKATQERRFQYLSRFAPVDCGNENTEAEFDDLSLNAFQKAKVSKEGQENDVEFDGYDFLDIIYAKWGQCFDVEFNRVDSFGFKSVYLKCLSILSGT